MSYLTPNERRQVKEAALGRADSFGRVLFTGMTEDEYQLFPNYREALPRGALPIVTAFIDALLEAHIETPVALAQYLTARHPPAARGCTQAIWNALTIVNVAMTGQPNWAEIYAKIGTGDEKQNDSGNESERANADERDAGDNSEADEDPDSPEAITRWAEGIGEEIATIEGLLEATGVRRRINPDLADAIELMKAGLTAMSEGELPSDAWRLELILSRRMVDGTSQGTCTYALSVNDSGFRAECYGTERQQGEAAVRWTGAIFSYRPLTKKEERGDIQEFTTEFSDAIKDAGCVLSVEFNGEFIGRLPEDYPSDSEGELLVKRLLRQLIGELQGMQDTLSGDDSCLVNVWDEICAQQQFQESFSWDVYEVSIRALIEGTVEEIPSADRVKLWLLTDDGGRWSDEKESDDEQPFPCPNDIANFLYDRLISASSDYRNHRIISYLNGPYQDD